MDAESFIDTSVFAYQLEAADTSKAAIADQLIGRPRRPGVAVSPFRWRRAIYRDRAHSKSSVRTTKRRPRVKEYSESILDWRHSDAPKQAALGGCCTPYCHGMRVFAFPVAQSVRGRSRTGGTASDSSAFTNCCCTGTWWSSPLHSPPCAAGLAFCRRFHRLVGAPLSRLETASRPPVLCEVLAKVRIIRSDDASLLRENHPIE